MDALTVEHAALADFACHPGASRGRRHAEDAPEGRTGFQRDRDRVIHCNAFRRLEYKTQVFVNHEGDRYRTRLTHTLEVSQVARGASRMLRLNVDLAEAIALAHDLGHTPFGHSGQRALNRAMLPFGGFEHNRQSLRIVDLLEDRYAAFSGLNLTFETREGIAKHRTTYDDPISQDIYDFTASHSPSLEAQVANLADEIAYTCHDVDDGVGAGILSLDDLDEVPLFAERRHQILAQYPGLAANKQRYETLRGLIHDLIVDLVGESRERITGAGVRCVDAVREYPRDLIGFSPAMGERFGVLKKFLNRQVYRHWRVARMGKKAERVIGELFAAFSESPELLPPQYRHMLTAGSKTRGPAETDLARVVADYISGMTDRYAIDEYRKMFDPSARA